jgi:hypothetical protein
VAKSTRSFYRNRISHLEKLNIIVPKTIMWRKGDDGENSIGYYLVKWEKCLLLLNLDGSGDIGSFPGPKICEADSQSNLLSHLEENRENYNLI